MIVITSKRDGFRRCGVAHPARPTEHPDDAFTAEQLVELLAEPNLVVNVVVDPEPESDQAPAPEAETQAPEADQVPAPEAETQAPEADQPTESDQAQAPRTVRTPAKGKGK